MLMGVPELDAADQRMSLLLHDLNQAIAADSEGAERLMQELLLDALSHFEEEERVLSDRAYPLSKGHAALHAQIRAELEHAAEELRQIKIPAMRAEYGLLVTQLLVEHMRQETLKYRHFLGSASASADGA